MIEKEAISFIEGTATALSVYSVRKYVPHYHADCLEIVFVLDGEADLLSSYDFFHLKKGDFTVINERDVHCIRSGKDNLIASLYIDLNEFSLRHEYVKYLYFMCESFNVNSMQETYCPEMRRLITNVILEIIKADYDTDRINGFLQKIMALLIDKFDMVFYHNGREIPENQLQRYYRIIREVEEHYDEKLELEDLAQREFIGTTYISQFWKKMTNMNFTEYLNSRRIEKAERMLLSTGKSINEISLNCGFSDPKYIYKNFKKWYGQTPSQHKKKYEDYKAEGNRIITYGYDEILDKFGRTLAYVNLDEEDTKLMRYAEHADDWTQRYETQMGRYSGSKLKREMIRESHHALGLREIYLPLFDGKVIGMQDGEIEMDETFCGAVLQNAKELGHILCIELAFHRYPVNDWEKLIRAFVSMIKEKGSKEMLQRCKFIIYFDKLENDAAARELIDKVSDIIDAKNIKMAIRFD